MIEKFIASKSRIKIMRLFLLKPEKEFYFREIARETDSNTNSVRLELRELEKIDFISSKRKGRQKYFTVNKDFYIYGELKSIFLKEFGILNAIKETIPGLKKMDFAFIYGSVAENRERSDSDIDLMIIGKPDLNELNSRIKRIEEAYDRTINYVIYSKEELVERKKKKTHFILNVLKSKKIMIKGSEYGL
ncbi:MAG: nucleotidyltransferase domain-containing protein [archaeon]